MKTISKIIDILLIQFRNKYWGFVQGHSYLTEANVEEAKHYLTSPDDSIVKQFEKEFAKIIGDGNGVSFASGRMALYTLLQILEIGSGDEVILPGFTCSVVINAILRSGAKPIYTDIDTETYGSNPKTIEKSITSHTKLVIAQHSFGIPCKIEEIVSIARKRNIPVVEDCALTLGSKSNGIAVGNFGDAAFFSTDHSKPINTLIGGFLYTKNVVLFNKIISYHNSLPHLSSDHQQDLFKRFFYERKYFTPTRFMRTKLYSLFEKLYRQLFPTYLRALLVEDTRNPTIYSHTKYPYPAKLPSFLAYLGLQEIKRWGIEQSKRKELLKKYLQLISQGYTEGTYSIPHAYLDSRYDIIPLRFVFESVNADFIKQKLRKVLDIDWIWFQRPIVATNAPMSEFFYEDHSCVIAETLGKKIINYPCYISIDDAHFFFT